MSLFTKQRIVKSYSVEVSSPHLVEPTGEFEQLPFSIPLVRVPSVGASGSTDKELKDLCETIPQTAQCDQDDAAKLLLEAQQQAEHIIQAALSEAAEIRSVAEADIGSLWQRTAAEARQEAMAQVQLESGRIIARANSLLLTVQELYASELRRAQEQLLHLAIGIAERITRSALAVKPELLLGIVRSLDLEAAGADEYRLHVSPEDAEWFAGTIIEHQLPISWVKDQELKQGDLFIECQQGIIDARIEVQLDKLEQVLREELSSELEPTSPES